LRKIGLVVLLPVLALGSALGLAACGSSSGKEGGTLTASYAAFPEYLDPALSYELEGWTAMYDTYLPLLTYAHADGEEGSKVVPALAKSLPKISNGGKTYTLTLQKGLKYSDGTPVKASDFAGSIERLFKLNSPGTSFYSGIAGAEKFAKTKSGGIAGIKTNDESGEIVINLVKPRGTFTNELGLLFAALLPPGTPAKNLSADPPPGTGPYAITKVESVLGEGQREAGTGGAERPRQQDRGQRRPQRLDPGEQRRAGQDRLDAVTGALRSVRVDQGQIRGNPVPGRPADQHLLLLDEHDRAALRRRQGAPSGQLRGQHGSPRTALLGLALRHAPDPSSRGARARGVRPLPV
jgi:hypothetical protein